MARILNEREHTAKRNKILDTAQRLIYTKGFELMTIQDILDEMGISKGAFFHYYPSKAELLQALIERMMDEITTFVQSIVDDPNLTARQKLEGYFSSALHWKTARKEIMLSLLSVWYQDENAIVRQKVFSSGIQRVTPALAGIIRQGNQEAAWDAPFPEETAKILFNLLQGMSDTLGEKLLSPHPILDKLWLTRVLDAYTQGVERVLGAPPHSLTILSLEDLQSWFTPLADNPPAAPSNLEPYRMSL
ncbi:MAG: TetR/AcrR family transcriptional regulator [Chloroflexota bacterium]